MENKTWKVAVGSRFKLHKNITAEETIAAIKRAFQYLVDPNSEMCKLQNSTRSQISADFQYNKMAEIAKKTVDNLVVEVHGDDVSCQSKFDIEFPAKDFTKPFVQDWVCNHGLGQVAQATILESSEIKMQYIAKAMPEELKTKLSHERTVAKQILGGIDEDTIAIKCVTQK